MSSCWWPFWLFSMLSSCRINSLLVFIQLFLLHGLHPQLLFRWFPLFCSIYCVTIFFLNAELKVLLILKVPRKIMITITIMTMSTTTIMTMGTTTIMTMVTWIGFVLLFSPTANIIRNKSQGTLFTLLCGVHEGVVKCYLLHAYWLLITIAEHHDHHHSHDHVHDPGVSSVSIVCEGILDLEKVGILIFFSQLFIYT